MLGILASVAQEHLASALLPGRLAALTLSWGRGFGPLCSSPRAGELHGLPLLTFGIVLHLHRLCRRRTLGVLPALVIDVPEMGSTEDNLRQLIDDETAGFAALHAVIPLTGQRPESEAL